MAIRQLTDGDIERICQMIESWPMERKFGWEEIREGISSLLEIEDLSNVWSRQQLPKYVAIKKAYEKTIQKIRDHKAKRRGKAQVGEEDLSLRERQLKERVTALEAENQRLEGENDRLHEQFERWLYNAYCRGVSEAVLDQPLPVPSKEAGNG